MDRDAPCGRRGPRLPLRGLPRFPRRLRRGAAQRPQIRSARAPAARARHRLCLGGAKPPAQLWATRDGAGGRGAGGGGIGKPGVHGPALAARGVRGGAAVLAGRGGLPQCPCTGHAHPLFPRAFFRARGLGLAARRPAPAAARRAVGLARRDSARAARGHPRARRRHGRAPGGRRLGAYAPGHRRARRPQWRGEARRAQGRPGRGPLLRRRGRHPPQRTAGHAARLHRPGTRGRRRRVPRLPTWRAVLLGGRRRGRRHRYAVARGPKLRHARRAGLRAAARRRADALAQRGARLSLGGPDCGGRGTWRPRARVELCRGRECPGRSASGALGDRGGRRGGFHRLVARTWRYGLAGTRRRVPGALDAHAHRDGGDDRNGPQRRRLRERRSRRRTHRGPHSRRGRERGAGRAPRACGSRQRAGRGA